MCIAALLCVVTIVIARRRGKLLDLCGKWETMLQSPQRNSVPLGVLDAAVPASCFALCPDGAFSVVGRACGEADSRLREKPDSRRLAQRATARRQRDAG